LGDDNTSFVLSPDSEFFRYFDSPTLPSVEQASGLTAPAQPAAEGAATQAPVDGAETSIARPPATASTIE
jgi:hypothetical protein